MSAVETSQDLKGKKAVVTGSTSGIGRAIALELARAGADVIVHGRRSVERAQATADDIESLGRQAEVFLYDIAEPSRQEALIEEAWNWQGQIDIWVNNAGADCLTGEAREWSFERKLEQLLHTDVVATMRLSRLAGSKMKKQGSGVILNMGWDQALTGMAGDSGELFSAAKGAVMAFSKSLALSLAPEVRVNCLAPGWIKTEWGEGASEYWQERAKKECALGRWGEPSDVARVAHFLASPAAEFITGQTLSVNGGWKPSS